MTGSPYKTFLRRNTETTELSCSVPATIEYTVGEFRAYERLSGDRVRLYLTEERGGSHVLLYTAVVPACVLFLMGKKCFEIAGKKHVLPDWAHEKADLATAH